jgi:hypothetical protein
MANGGFGDYLREERFELSLVTDSDAFGGTELLDSLTHARILLYAHIRISNKRITSAAPLQAKISYLNFRTSLIRNSLKFLLPQ